jgi:hypothetical protein
MSWIADYAGQQLKIAYLLNKYFYTKKLTSISRKRAPNLGLNENFGLFCTILPSTIGPNEDKNEGGLILRAAAVTFC